MPTQRTNKATVRQSNMDDIVLLAGRANPELATSISNILRVDVTCPITSFSDGEIRVRVKPNLRRRKVFLIQPTSAPVNDHLMELVLMADAAKRASASEVTAVIPYFGYARQDRKEMSRVPISAAAVSSLLVNAGIDRILTVDIHSEQMEGSIKQPWDNLYGSYSLLPVLKERKLKNLIVAAPDKNGMLRATGYAKLLNAEGVALVYKERDVTLNNVSNTMGMIGEVKGRDVLMVDDMIDTAGTIVHAANFIKKKGARSVRVAATHGLFSGNALKIITDSAIEEMVVTDTIRSREEVVKSKKITIVSVAPLLAEAMKRIRTGESISNSLIL